MRERRDDAPGEELLDFAVWCRRRDTLPTPHRYGVIWSEREWERWRADADLECQRRHDEYPRWIRARQAWADAHGGAWPVLEWDLVLDRGACMPRKREQPGSPVPSQRPPRQ
jgi:hypothetical protein